MAFQNRVFKFTIHGKPPVKRRPRTTRKYGGMYTDNKTVQDEIRVRDAFLSYYAEQPRSEARFSVEIKIYTKRNLDGDNVEKAILDALNKVLWENDRQVKQMFWMILPLVTDLEMVEVKALEL